MPASLQKIRLHHLIEALVDIDRYIIYMILNGMTMHQLHIGAHLLAIPLRYLLREHLNLTIGLHIDKVARLIAESKV